MSREIQDILDECIDRISLRGETLDDCLKAYPEREADLRPLLQVARSLTHIASVAPRSDFKAEARYRLHAAMNSRKERPRVWALPVFGFHRRWATSAAALAALFLIGGSTVGAASASLPGDPLYGVKIATENVQLAMAPSEASKVMLQVSLADNRVREMMALTEGGRDASLEELTQRLNRHLATVEEAAAAGMMAEGRSFSRRDKERLQSILEANAIRHMAVLDGVMERAPERARSPLQYAMLASQRGYETALAASGGNLERVRGRWFNMWRQRRAQMDRTRSQNAAGEDATPAPAYDSRFRPSPGMGPGMGTWDAPAGDPQAPQNPADIGPGLMGSGQRQGDPDTAPEGRSGVGPGMMGPDKEPGGYGPQAPQGQPPTGMGPGMGPGAARGMGPGGRPR